MSGPDSIPIVCSVPPNGEIDIPVQLVTPEKPGYYQGHWRLQDPQGKKFGEEVRVLIQVTDEISQNQIIPFYSLLMELEQMGFNDKSKNNRLLMKHKGDIDKVVLKLLKKEKKEKKQEN